MSWFIQAGLKQGGHRLDSLEHRMTAINDMLESLSEKLKAVDYISVVVPEQCETTPLEVLSDQAQAVVGDVKSFQVGNTLVTNKIGLIDVNKVLRVGEEDFQIAMKIPFAVLAVKSPVQ